MLSVKYGLILTSRSSNFLNCTKRPKEARFSDMSLESHAVFSACSCHGMLPLYQSTTRSHIFQARIDVLDVVQLVLDIIKNIADYFYD